jgi:drug/metabolite transporter (DMT)-like permease
VPNLTNNRRLGSGPLLALGSAFLFGASTPIAKLLLGVSDPLLLLLLAGHWPGARDEAPLRARDLPWLGAIVLFGGILGPALLMSGLTLAPGSSGALLLNIEGLATMAIAWLVFRENVDRPISWVRWRSSPAWYCSPGRTAEAPAHNLNWGLC